MTGGATRSKSPAAIRHRVSAVEAAVTTTLADEGFDAYDRVAVSAQHEEMIHESRAEMEQTLEDKLEAGGSKVTVKFVEEMAEGRKVYDKFRVMSTAAAGLRESQIEQLRRLSDRIVPMAGSNAVLFALVDHERYEKRPLRCCDLTWSQLASLVVVVCLACLCAIPLILYDELAVFKEFFGF